MNKLEIIEKQNREQMFANIATKRKLQKKIKELEKMYIEELNKNSYNEATDTIERKIQQCKNKLAWIELEITVTTII